MITTTQPYLVCIESRRHPVLRRDGAPQQWLDRTPAQRAALEEEARPGEFFVCYIGVFAGVMALEHVTVQAGDLHGADGGMIPASAIRCFNLEGTDSEGRPMRMQVDVPPHTLQAFWLGVQVTEGAQGRFTGEITVQPANAPAVMVTLALAVSGEPLADGGDGQADRLSRLRWLDSTLMLDDHGVTRPFTPMRVDEHGIHCLGRTLKLAPNGLPLQVESSFNATNTQLDAGLRFLLDNPVQFMIQTAGGSLTWVTDGVRITSTGEDVVEWEALSRAGDLVLCCRGRMEYDGCVAFRLTLTAKKDIEISDIRLDVPYRADAARYVMGLGRQGGRHTQAIAWQWDVERYQDCVWLGDVNIGAQWRFKGANYHRPLLNIYYPFHPLNLPESWGNEGKGGIDVPMPADDRVTLTAFSGARHMQAGEALDFDFDLYLTPFKPLDTAEHWQSRYFHSGGPAFRDLDAITQAGANVVNIHHANELNPFINYPYHPDSLPALVEYIHRAHDMNMKVKIYYTTRELTNHLPELPALFSLNGEVIFPGPGEETRTVIHPHGPHAWLREHLVAQYLPAWEANLQGMGEFDGQLDLAVITTPDTRWNNFYLEGLRWLLRHADIDGLYIDDTALDRRSLQRARKILDREKDGCLIDLHSWNHYNDMARFASCANVYLEILPYIDRLWFGEGFDYHHTAPDYWLVEISGIPFGLMGEMLEGGGNRWLGMVYGMTARMPWNAESDPRHVWKLWDDFGIENAQMLGYWDPACPVRTDHPDVLATVYRRPDRTLVAIGSWANEETTIRLDVDWQALGLNPAAAHLHAPAVENFQPECNWRPDESITIAPRQGWLMMIEG